MSEDEIKAVWCVPPDELWFRVVAMKLDEHIEEATQIATMMQTATNPGTMAFAAGGLESLRTLREEILRTRAEAYDTPPAENL